MTAAKVAITIPAEVLEAAKKEVAAGHAPSLSALVSDAVDEKVRRNELAALLDALDAKHGKPDRAARAWAKKVLARSS
ncbi:MAG TPA: toxin-antitoxin system antitoxin subunit [Polyangia bacterium]|nr:toxin-antitoxin system antitoxin subunit [Polyangia bacterium]